MFQTLRCTILECLPVLRKELTGFLDGVGILPEELQKVLPIQYQRQLFLRANLCSDTRHMALKLVHTFHDGYGEIHVDLETNEFYLFARCTGLMWSIACIKLTREKISEFDENPKYADDLAYHACKNPEQFKDRTIAREKWLKMGGPPG